MQSLKSVNAADSKYLFNGGVSGLSGTFFGLEYSTNNLLGRGETLAFQFGAGNRQQSFQFSFTEPYFQDRPISVGFSLFASRYKFFGEGTFLSQNTDAITGALNPFGTITADESTLFTQTTYGANVFATAPLSEIFFKKRAFSTFSRIGLSYQFSATTITDPPVNSTGNPADTIPIVFAQPKCLQVELYLRSFMILDNHQQMVLIHFVEHRLPHRLLLQDWAETLERINRISLILRLSLFDAKSPEMLKFLDLDFKQAQSDHGQ